MAAELAVIARAAHVTALGRGFFCRKAPRSHVPLIPQSSPLSSFVSRNATALEASMVRWRRDNRSVDMSRGYVEVEAEGEVSRR